MDSYRDLDTYMNNVLSLIKEIQETKQLINENIEKF